MADKLFRIILQVDDLDKASEFYGKLLDDPAEGFRVLRDTTSIVVLSSWHWSM